MRTNFTILLAEDDPHDASIFKSALTEAGAKTPLRVVKDGKEAMDYLQGSGQYADRQVHPMPTLAVFDLNMPRVNGLELLNWLRKESGLKRLPVIMMSSSHRQDDINRAYDSGANAYFVKPSNFDDLVDMLKRTIAFWTVTLLTT